MNGCQYSTPDPSSYVSAAHSAATGSAHSVTEKTEKSGGKEFQKQYKTSQETEFKKTGINSESDFEPDTYSVANTLRFKEYKDGKVPPQDEKSIENFRQALRKSGIEGNRLKAVFYDEVHSNQVFSKQVSSTQSQKSFEKGLTSQSVSNFIKAYESAFDKRVVFFKMDPDALFPIDGAILAKESNTVFVNSEAAQGIDFLLGHELFHSISSQNPVVYDRLKNTLLPMAKGLEEYKDKIREIGAYSESELEDEVLADFVGSQFIKPEFWKTLQAQDKTLFQKVASTALEILNKIVTALRKLPRNTDALFADRLEEAQKFLASQLTEYAKGPKPSTNLPNSDAADLSSDLLKNNTIKKN